MEKTLKSRISLLYLILVSLSALIGLNAVYSLYRLNNSIDGLMTANYKSIKAINRMIESIEKQDNAILTYIFANNQTGISRFNDGQNDFFQAIAIEIHNVTEPGEKKMASRLTVIYSQYLKSFSILQEIKNNAGRPAALRYHNQTLQPQSENIKRLLRSLTDLNEAAMFKSKSQANASAQRSLYAILITSLVAVIGGFVISRFFINRFFHPVTMLIETVKKVRAGDLNRQAAVVYQDEIGALATEFNNMTRRLLEYEKSNLGMLLAAKNRTLAIVKSISDPLIVLDKQYRISLINNAGEAVFAVSEAAVLEKHFLEGVSHSELFAYITAVIETDDATQSKLIVQNIAGTDNYFNVLVKAVRDETGNIHSIVVLLQNITQIKLVEKIKTDFIATVSHEFKTPLTSLLMGLSLLAEEHLGALTEAQLQTVQAMREDGDVLVNLVNDLLEISKIDSGKSIFRIQAASIGSIVAGSVRYFKEDACRQRVELICDIPPSLTDIEVDPEKIQWVINNLLQNALKHTRPDSSIKITVAEKYDKLCVSIQDTGIGIPPEYVNKVFERFFQVKGYDLEITGSGLGLAIAKEIVEAHGGEIWCESRVNEGSIFSFTLPKMKIRSADESGISG
jgi:PAS domain S-box-containing protein